MSSAEVFKVKDSVLAGAYDLYGRGQVSNFLKSFNLLNMYLEIDGRRLGNAETKGGTNPYFSTGAGGILQAVLNGFGGLDITPAGITQIKSVLPAAWKSLTLKGIGVERETYTVK